MKINHHGQAEILSKEELTTLFEQGLKTSRDRALFAICLYTGCRISEAIVLDRNDIKGGYITLKKGTTKGKLGTRQIEIQPGLQQYLDAYEPQPHNGSDALFPGQRGVSERLTPRSADKILREACQRVGLIGVSTHSFRRTALTMMSNAGVPLRHIQEISGHRTLAALQQYLEVTPQQKSAALKAIGF
jgi:integrase/recombinase XerD